MNEHEPEQECYVEPLEKEVDLSGLKTAKVAYLAVWGMGCPRCALRVHNGLLRLHGVLGVQVSLEDGIAATVYDPGQVTPPSLVQAVADAGNDGRHVYHAQLMGLMSAANALQLSHG
jgi:copper chaperone CopZ